MTTQLLLEGWTAVSCTYKHNVNTHTSECIKSNGAAEHSDPTKLYTVDLLYQITNILETLEGTKPTSDPDIWNLQQQCEGRAPGNLGAFFHIFQTSNSYLNISKSWMRYFTFHNFLQVSRNLKSKFIIMLNDMWLLKYIRLNKWDEIPLNKFGNYTCCFVFPSKMYGVLMLIFCCNLLKIDRWSCWSIVRMNGERRDEWPHCAMASR